MYIQSGRICGVVCNVRRIDEMWRPKNICPKIYRQRWGKRRQSRPCHSLSMLKENHHHCRSFGGLSLSLFHRCEWNMTTRVPRMPKTIPILLVRCARCARDMYTRIARITYHFMYHHLIRRYVFVCVLNIYILFHMIGSKRTKALCH